MRRAVLFVASVLAAGSASAEPVTLKPVAAAAAYKPAGRAIDVLGIMPGMTPEAVKPILEKLYGTVNTVEENMGLEYRGVAVATQNYISRMTARKDTDEIGVVFATPTTGNGVVEVSRQYTFLNPAEAPLLATARKELADKYGPPAFDGPALFTGEVELLAWSYKGNAPGTCDKSSCRTDLADGLSVGDMQSYQRAVRRGHELTIIGMLLAGIGDTTRTSSVVTTVSDTATKLRTLDAAVKQMQDAASAPSKPASRPGGTR